jgi:hypothetical protein
MPKPETNALAYFDIELWTQTSKSFTTLTLDWIDAGNDAVDDQEVQGRPVQEEVQAILRSGVKNLSDVTEKNKLVCL